MTKAFKLTFLILGFIILSLLTLSKLTSPASARIPICATADITKYQGGDENIRTYTNTQNRLIEKLCIKILSREENPNLFPGNHSDPLGNGTYAHNCYIVTGVGTSSAQVTRSRRWCPGIAHLDIFLSDPQPSPKPEDKFVLKLELDGPHCDSSTFTTFATATNNGQPVPGVTVDFSYNNTMQSVTTDSNGKAQTQFNYYGANQLKVTAPGYTLQETPVSDPDNCESRGEVQSTSVDSTPTPQSGQVLGASTLAPTGTAIQNLMTLTFGSGLSLVFTAIKKYDNRLR